MPPNAVAEGTYLFTWSPTATYEWQATFGTPTSEGLTGSTSPVVTVSVSGCTIGCPQFAPDSADGAGGAGRADGGRPG